MYEIISYAEFNSCKSQTNENISSSINDEVEHINTIMYHSLPEITNYLVYKSSDSEYYDKNNSYIEIAYYINLYSRVYICKGNDDYYYIEIKPENSLSTYYKVDQIESLKEINFRSHFN